MQRIWGTQKMCVQSGLWPLSGPSSSSDVSHPLMSACLGCLERSHVLCPLSLRAESGGLGQRSATPLSTPESTPRSLPGLCSHIRIAPQISHCVLWGRTKVKRTVPLALNQWENKDESSISSCICGVLSSCRTHMILFFKYCSCPLNKKKKLTRNSQLYLNIISP